MTAPAPAPRSARLPITLVLVVALAAAAGLLAARLLLMADTPPTPPTLENGLAYPQPRPLPPFSLDRADGSRLDAAALAGRWHLVFIGFTHCPDVCPTTLAELGAALGKLDDIPAEKRPQIIFVSVDPERDSADLAQQYARHFSPDALGVTADHTRLAPFTRSLGMVYMQSPLGNGDYTVDHSASVAVLDPQGRLVAQLRPPLDPAKVAADLRRLIEAEA